MDIPIIALYKSNKVIFDDNDEYHCVKSNKLIEKNSIILIEHCFCECDKSIVMKSLVKNHEYLFNSLYPRTTKWTEEIRNNNGNDINDLLHQKIINNCFGLGSKQYCFGNDISYFNHSNKPNCVVHLQDIYILSMKTTIMFVVSLEDIEPNNELFIEYSKKIRFENGQKIIVDQEVNSVDLVDSYNDFLKSKYVKQILKKHIIKDTFIKTVINQYCAHMGLYISKNFVSITPRFEKIYEEIMKKKFINEHDKIICFLDEIENKIRKNVYEILLNDICVFVPSHINYDLQLTYLSKCLESLLCQNEKVDIYVSISYEEKYREDALIFVDKYKSKGIIFNVENTQKYQMEHIYLLSKLIENKWYDLIMFCDDDDTYEYNRIEQMCMSMYHTYLSIGKENIKKLGGVREYLEESECPILMQTPEYWAYGIKMCVLYNFFDFFKNDMDLLKHIFSDEYFREYLRTNKEYPYWGGLNNTKLKPLYNYNINNPNSVCGGGYAKKCTIDQKHKSILLLYTIKGDKNSYNKYITNNKLSKKINKIFPEKERVINIIKKMSNKSIVY